MMNSGLEMHGIPEGRYTPAKIYSIDNYSNIRIMKNTGETFS